MSYWLNKKEQNVDWKTPLHTSKAMPVNCCLVLISSPVVLIVLEWSNGDQCRGFIWTVRGECGAAVIPSQVFSKENILIQPDKTRICLILLQACTLNYSRPTLLCLLSLCEKEADGASSRAYCSELWMVAPGPHPVTKQHIHKCGECSRKQLVVVVFFVLFSPFMLMYFFFPLYLLNMFLGQSYGVMPDQMAELWESRNRQSLLAAPYKCAKVKAAYCSDVVYTTV